MTDRDTFAAAALTGLMRFRGDSGQPGATWKSTAVIAAEAYELADAMLRERGIAERDNCVVGNNPEMPCPVTNTLPKEKRAEVSDTLYTEHARSTAANKGGGNHERYE